MKLDAIVIREPGGRGVGELGRRGGMWEGLRARGGVQGGRGREERKGEEEEMREKMRKRGRRRKPLRAAWLMRENPPSET